MLCNRKMSPVTNLLFLLFALQVATASGWSKSVEICDVVSGRHGAGEVIAKSEHPIMLCENSANVASVQEKLSREAFSGTRVRLLNSKNILIADADGTRGMHNNKGL